MTYKILANPWVEGAGITSIYKSGRHRVAEKMAYIWAIGTRRELDATDVSTYTTARITSG